MIYNLKIKSFGLLLGIIFFTLSFNAQAQTLFFEPDEIFLSIGETFPVKIFIDTENKTINVLLAKIKFDPQKISIVEVNQGGSVFTLIPEAADISPSLKTISLSGAKPNGFNSAKALVAQLDIKALDEGISDIYFGNDTLAYLNDGLGTEVKLHYKGLKIKTIKTFAKNPLTIFSKTHPDQSKWYRQKEATIFWPLNEGSFYSYEVSKDYNKEPDNIADEPVGFITLKNLPEGISYFHLKECSLDGKCGPKKSFRFQIDSTPPQSEIVFFEIEKQKFFSILSNDDNSGVDKIERFIFHQNLDAQSSGVIGFGIWQKVSMPFPLSQKSAEDLIFRVIDKAGNYQTIKVSPPSQNYFIIGVSVFIFALLIFFILYLYKIRPKLKNFLKKFKKLK